jgi:hypothetical protein
MTVVPLRGAPMKNIGFWSDSATAYASDKNILGTVYRVQLLASSRRDPA